MFIRYFFVMIEVLFCSQCFCTDLDDAMEKYTKAEQSTVRAEKEQLLNDSLHIFLFYAKENPSGKLLYNIGTVYAKLGDYGMAIAFFRKAEQLIPRDLGLKRNLDRVIDLANVRGYQIESSLLDRLGFKWCSPLERKLILFGSVVFSFLFFSLNLWLPFVGLRWFSRFAIGITLFLLILFSFHYYFVSPRGVIVRATALRVEGTESSEAKVILYPGEMIEILDIDGHKSFVRVRTASYLRGYLSAESVFVVN